MVWNGVEFVLLFASMPKRYNIMKTANNAEMMLKTFIKGCDIYGAHWRQHPDRGNARCVGLGGITQFQSVAPCLGGDCVAIPPTAQNKP